MIVVPDYDLYHSITWALQYIREDISSDKPIQQQYLYALINGYQYTQNSIGNYELYEQALEIFNRGIDEQRFLECFIGYNVQRSMFPTIHLLIPTESGSHNGLGIDQGYQGEVYTDEAHTIKRDIYTRRFACTYQMLITSDNANEVVLIYNILRAVMIGLMPHLTQLGYLNINFSGQDMVIDGLNNPINVFHRSLNIHFLYETNCPSLDFDKLHQWKGAIVGHALPMPKSFKEANCECVHLEAPPKVFYSHKEYLAAINKQK